MPGHLDLHGLVEAMFHTDPRGRLIGEAPQLYVLRTADFVICRSHAELPDECAAALEAIAAEPRGRPSAWARDYGRYVSALAAVGLPGAVRAGPLFGFPHIATADERCVRITEANAGLIAGALGEWAPDATNGLPMTAVLDGSTAVSVCASVRASTTAHCAGVETAPAYRGRGYAGLAIIAWARLVRAIGAEPFYATTFDNLASQKVAHRIGLRLIGSEFTVDLRSS